MKAVYFPRSLLDIPAVANLSGAQKFFLSGLCLLADATGVVTLTNYQCVALSFLPSVASQLAVQLADRGLIAFDASTLEVFVTGWFTWQKTPAEAGALGTWAKQIVSARNRVRSDLIAESIDIRIKAAPIDKLEVVPLPTNILSTLRHRAAGMKWEATPLLLLLVLYSYPPMTSAGICVVDYDGLASLVSEASSEQVLGHLRDLDAAGAAVFDYGTGEIFLPARLRNANLKWHKKEIEFARAECISHRIKSNFSRVFKQTFGFSLLKTVSCALVDFSLHKSSSSGRDRRDAPSPAAATVSFLINDLGFPLTAGELDRLYKSALQRHKHSDRGRDEMHCFLALEFALSKKMEDEFSCAVVKKLCDEDGWPRQIKGRLKAAAAEHEAQRREAVQTAKFMQATASCDKSSLVGKTVLVHSTGGRFRVNAAGCIINTDGKITMFPKINEWLDEGLASLVTDDDDCDKVA